MASQDRVSRYYAAALALLAALLAAGLVVAGANLGNVWVLALLCVTTAVAERWIVPLSKTTELSVYLLPTVFAAVVLGPLPAGIVAAASMLGDPVVVRGSDKQRQPLLRWASLTCISFIIGSTAGLVAALMDAIIDGGAGTIIAVTFVAMAVAEGLDLGFAMLTAAVRGRSPRETLGALWPVAVSSLLIYTPVVAVLAVAYTEISPWTAPLFLMPALAFQRLYTLYQRERLLGEELSAANASLERANLSFAAALVRSLEAKDHYTAGHSAAVAIYSRDIARRMGLPGAVQDKAFLCGLVHDVGKIGLPASLLDKDGPLTLDERRQMQEHSVIGERILREVDTYSDIASIVRFHHERIDGEGYPDGVAAESIPLLSRIIAVADAYNAMTSDRPYRDAMPSRVARLRLAQAVESQFDTAVVAAFEAILAGADEAYRRATRDDFHAFTALQPTSPESCSESDDSSPVLVGAA